MATSNTQTFTSVLGPIIYDLICEKQGLGYHYDKEERNLLRFDRFCVVMGHHDLALPRELVDAWTAKQAHETEINRHHRISLMRVLGSYMCKCGYSAFVYPTQSTDRSASRYVPYIFSKVELAALFSAADACQPDSNSPYRDLVLPVLFRVLYGTGLRISEALALQRSDLDICSDTLHIRQAKLDKERCIPIHPVLLEQMELYLGKLELIFGPEGPLFPGPTGVAYTARTIYSYFRRFLWQANISHRGRGHGPRLHDLRYPNLNKIPTLAPKRCDSCQVRERRLGFSFIVCSSLSIQRRAFPWMYKTYGITIPSFLPTWKSRATQNSTWHGSPGS